MQSILFIADGVETSAVAESALMCERAVIARTSSATEALMLLNEEPFDVIVCAIDELSDDARDCLRAIRDEETPTVIVTRSVDVPIQSFDINMRVVAIDEGLQEISTALRQQLRRVTPRPVKTQQTGGFEFEFKFKADPFRIGRARAIAGGFVQRCTNMSDQELTRLELALEEALVNAVLHGSLEIDPSLRRRDPDVYQQELVERLTAEELSGRQVRVQLVLHKQTLSITVTDEGSGFDVKAALAALEIGRKRPVGRGLMTMHAFADQVEFNEVGNSVTLTRTLAVSAPPPQEPAADTSYNEIVAIPLVGVEK